MNNYQEEVNWGELKDMWMNSTQTKTIHVQMTDLVAELKTQVSQFEKESIQADLALLKENWTDFKGMVSDFEREAVEKDLAMVRRFIKKFLGWFKK